jgi:hypothetical protein
VIARWLVAGVVVAFIGCLLCAWAHAALRASRADDVS